MTNVTLTTTSAPNFCDEDGRAFLVQCPACDMENYTMNVSIGICTWCGYDLNEHKKIKIKSND